MLRNAALSGLAQPLNTALLCRRGLHNVLARLLARLAWNTLEDSITRPNIVCHDQFHVLVTMTPAINALLFTVIEGIMLILVRVKKHCIQFCGYFAN